MKISGLHITIIFLTTFFSAKSQQVSKGVTSVTFQSNLQTGILIGQKAAALPYQSTPSMGSNIKHGLVELALGLIIMDLKERSLYFCPFKKSCLQNPAPGSGMPVADTIFRG